MSPFDRMKFRAKCNSAGSLTSKAKSSFCPILFLNHLPILAHSRILHQNPLNSIPEFPDASSFANTFIFPMSFKQALSKIFVKVVASRIQSHLSSNSLSSSFQSAYRIFHSIETMLFKIHNDLILVMDHGEVTSLILLNLSAAFDTVDHSILLTRLRNLFGLDGLSLDWFLSHLSSHSQAVSINDSISAFSTLSLN